MITSAKIENFKCFKSLEVPDISRINIIGGKNNVGKTALLEALFLLFDRYNVEMILRQFAQRGVWKVPRGETWSVAPIFNNYDLSKEINISIAEKKTKESLKFQFEWLQPTKTYKNTESKSPIIITDEKYSNSYQLKIEHIIGKKKEKYQLVHNPSSVQIQSAGGNNFIELAVFLGHYFNIKKNAERFSEIEISGKITMLIDFLKIIEPRLTDLAMVSVSDISIIYGDIGIGRKMPIPIMGEGMHKLLTLILCILYKKGTIIFVDEFENGIHHSVMVKVWEAVCRAAKEADCQIFATTHSYECLQSAIEGVANAKMKKEFRYIRLDRENEEIAAKTYSYERLAAALESRWEVR